MKTWSFLSFAILLFSHTESHAQGGWSTVTFTLKSVEPNIYQPSGSTVFWVNFMPAVAVPNGPNHCGYYSTTDKNMLKLRSSYLEGAQAMTTALVDAMNNNLSVRVLYDNNYCFVNSLLICKTTTDCSIIPN